MADDFFDNEVRFNKRGSKKYHQGLKMFCRYENKSKILDLKHGPISNNKDVQDAEEGKIEMEDIKVYRDRIEIAKEQKKWT